MAGTTSNGLPYPTGTDRVADGDNAIQALAEAVNPWAPSTYAYDAEGSPINTSGLITVRRRGKSAHLLYDLTCSSDIAAGQSLGQIPAGYYPAAPQFAQAFNVTNPSIMVLVDFRANGLLVLALGAISTGMRLVGSISYALPATQATALPAPDVTDDDDDTTA